MEWGTIILTCFGTKAPRSCLRSNFSSQLRSKTLKTNSSGATSGVSHQACKNTLKLLASHIISYMAHLSLGNKSRIRYLTRLVHQYVHQCIYIRPHPFIVLELTSTDISLLPLAPTLFENKYFPVPIEDYLLGLSDLTGELMRFAISSLPLKGGRSTAQRVCVFVRQCKTEFESLAHHSRDLTKKQATTIQSLHKIEDGSHSSPVPCLFSCCYWHL
jgi:Translin family